MILYQQILANNQILNICANIQFFVNRSIQMQHYKSNMMQSSGGPANNTLLPGQAAQERYNSGNQAQTGQAQNPESNFRDKSQNSRSNPGILASAQNYKPDAYSKDEVQFIGQQNQQQSQKQGASYLSAPLHQQQQHNKSQGHGGQHLRPLAPPVIDTHQSHFNPMRNNSLNSPSPSPSALVKDSARHNQNQMHLQQDRSALPPNLQTQSNINSAYQPTNFAQKQKMYGNQATQPGEGGSVLAASVNNNGGGQHDFHDSLGQGLQQQQYLMGMQRAAMQGQPPDAIEHEHGGVYQMQQQAGRMLMADKKAYVVQQQDSDFDVDRAPPAQGTHKKVSNFITGNKSTQQVLNNSQNLHQQPHNQFHKYRVLDSPERVEDLLNDKRIQQHDSMKGFDDQGQQPYLPQANPNSPLQFQHQLSHNAASSQPHLAQQPQNTNQNNLMQSKPQMMAGGVAPPSQMYNMKKCSISQVQYNSGLQLEQQMQKGSGSLIGRPDQQAQGLSSLDHQNQQYPSGGAQAQKQQTALLHSIQMDQMIHEQMDGRHGAQYLYPPGVEPDEPIVERDALLARLRQGMGSQLVNSEEHHTNQQFAVNATNLAAVHQQQYIMQSQNAAGNLGGPTSQNGHSGGQQRQPYQGATSQALNGQPQSKVAAQKMLSQQTRQSRNANGAKSSSAQHVAVDAVPGLATGHQDMIFHQTSMQQPASQHRLVASAMNQSSFQLGGVAGMGMGGGGPPPSNILSPPRMSEMFGGMDNQIIPGPQGKYQFYQMLRNAMNNPQDNQHLGDHEYDPAGNLVDHAPQMQLFDNGHIRPSSSLCHRPVGATTNPLQQPQAQIHLSQLSARGGMPPAQHPIQGQLNGQIQRFPAALDPNVQTPIGDALSPQPQEMNNLGRHQKKLQYGRYASQQLLAGGQDQGAPPPLMAAHSQPKQSMKLINLCKGEMHQPQSQVTAVGNNQVVQSIECNQYQPVPGGANVIGGCAADGHQGQVQTMGHPSKAHVPAPVVGQMGPAPSLVSQTYPIKETLRISERFNIKHKLGQGTFSFIYQAFDNFLQKDVALKVEKKDKNKSILIFEYNVLQSLKGLKHVCNAHDFVKNSEQNLIVMDLLGANLAKVRKVLETNYSLKIAVQLVIEMLAAIEEVHNRGYIHRDVKASNFVLSQDYRKVFIVDFGLAKKHLDNSQKPVKQRKTADFRGTVSFASLNAHNNIDLSRRDDLWSLYFVILDFLEEKLEWRENKEYTMEEVKGIKHKCLENPEKHLWIKTKNNQEVKNIFYHIRGLHYADKPDYELIRQQLISIYEKSQSIYPQPHLKHFDSAELSMPPYSSASQQLMRYGGNQKAFMGPSSNPMYAHMLNPAGDSNLNSVAQLIPSQNLSPRGGILHSQRTDLAFDEPNNGHQYNFNDGIPDWYSKQYVRSGNYEAANRQVLHQDDYQKEKMFSEFFTQVLCGPANTNAVAQSQAAVPAQQQFYKNNPGGLKQMAQSQPQAQPMQPPFTGQQLPQNMMKSQANQAVSVPAGSKMCNQQQAQSQQQSQQNLMFSIQRKQCKRMQNMGGGMQGGNHMSQQQMMQATNIQGLAAEDVPLQQQQVAAGQMLAMQSQQQSQAALQQTNGEALHHINMPPMGMEGASPSQLPLCSQMTDPKQQQVYAGGISAQPPSNYGDQHDVLGPSPDVNQAPDGYLHLDQQQQLNAAADSAMLFRMQSAAPHTSEFYDGLEENNPLRQLGMGATTQANEDKYLKRSYAQQQALAAQSQPLDQQNLMLTQSQQPEDLQKSALEAQQPMQMHQQLQYPIQRPKQRKREHKQNEKNHKQTAQRSGLQQMESNGSSGSPPRKLQKVDDHQQMGTVKNGNMNVPLSSMPTRQAVGGACDQGNADGVVGAQQQLDDQMGRQMGGNNVGGAMAMLPSKENHGRAPQQRLLPDSGANMASQRQKQLQSKIPPPKDQQIEGNAGNQQLQHININQNIYLTQPFLLLPQQNADGNKLGGIIPQHHAAPGQNLQGLFNQQSQEQQLAASNDRHVGPQGQEPHQQQQILQSLMPPPSQPPQKSQNGNEKQARNQQQMVPQSSLQSLKFAAGQSIYDQHHASQIPEGPQQLSPASFKKVQFLKKVLSLQQMSMRCLNVGAAASLQQMGPMKGSMDPTGKQSLPVGLASHEHILQLEQDGKLDIADIDFSNLKPIKYAYHPELFELPFNNQLKKQLQAFNRQRTKGPSKGQANLPPQIKSDCKIFHLEEMDPQQLLETIEQTKQYASLQKDGHFDKLTFNQYDYVCHAYEQNVQDSMGQIPEQEANQGQQAQSQGAKGAHSGGKSYQGSHALK